jgi:hypothetical protein
MKAAKTNGTKTGNAIGSASDLQKYYDPEKNRTLDRVDRRPDEHWSWNCGANPPVLEQGSESSHIVNRRWDCEYCRSNASAWNHSLRKRVIQDLRTS